MALKSTFECDRCGFSELKARAMLPVGWAKINATVVEAGEKEVVAEAGIMKHVPSYAENQTVLYLCPKCRQEPVAIMKNAFEDVLTWQKETSEKII